MDLKVQFLSFSCSFFLGGGGFGKMIYSFKCLKKYTFDSLTEYCKNEDSQNHIGIYATKKLIY